ncbi:uncharacterized protein LOC118470853 isoform X4 [Amphiprion ocellaris]|uniref:uncharacterized protein LOC118470853 isoform X4 n=1 Tax=Amphiprion ocellaris TaxID=80972 RepID=UPI00241130F6|nr:uncharacterized protein LOC118470853 isoform X4 [Amphiprion ocellaris]XP_054861142.1 uncharacterized protein LOC118470853 isoform X4 [Amphiprion ocellaris]
MDSSQKVKEANNKDDTHIPVDVRNIQVGDQVFIRVFRRQWNEPRRDGPFKVILTTPTALKVEGKPYWFHRNHCTRHRPSDPPGHLPSPSTSLSMPPYDEGAASCAPKPSHSASPSTSTSSDFSVSAPSPPQGERRSARLLARHSRNRHSPSPDSDDAASGSLSHDSEGVGGGRVAGDMRPPISDDERDGRVAAPFRTLSSASPMDPAAPTQS